MEAYKVTGNSDFVKYSKQWVEQNDWKGAKGVDPTKWKYNQGETPNHVLFGDWQICFQTYIDLYNIEPETKKIARTLGVINYEINTHNNEMTEVLR